MSRNIEQSDCMVRAIVDATANQDLLAPLRVIRERQLMNHGIGRFDVDEEMRNLAELLKAAGMHGAIELHESDSVNGIAFLLQSRRGDVFIGLQPTSEGDPAHIVYVNQKINQGFLGPNDWIPTERLMHELMNHGKIQVYVNVRIENP